MATIRCRASCERQPGHALDVEQRGELLGEAVNQIDFAVEVQDLGAERVTLRFFRDEMIEQRAITAA